MSGPWPDVCYGRNTKKRRYSRFEVLEYSRHKTTQAAKEVATALLFGRVYERLIRCRAWKEAMMRLVSVCYE